MGACPARRSACGQWLLDGLHGSARSVGVSTLIVPDKGSKEWCLVGKCVVNPTVLVQTLIDEGRGQVASSWFRHQDLLSYVMAKPGQYAERVYLFKFEIMSLALLPQQLLVESGLDGRD